MVGNASPEFGDALRKTRSDQQGVDLVRVKLDPAQIPALYGGICW